MKYFIGIIGIIVFLGFVWFVSNGKKRIRIWLIVVMFVLQLIFGYIFFNIGIGNFFVGGFVKGFNYLLEYVLEGINFVFGGFVNVKQMIFFMSVFLLIVFIFVLIGILQYWKVFFFIMKYIGFVLSKVNGMGKIEFYNVVVFVILGQLEVFISLKKQFGYFIEQCLYMFCVFVMLMVLMLIVGFYMMMLKFEYVVMVFVLNLFGGFIIVFIINLYIVSKDEDLIVVFEEEK